MKIMLNLETLGTRPGCVITSVGAVAFNTKSILYEFYERVDIKNSAEMGFHMEAPTVMWWMEQKDASRMELTKSGKPIAAVVSAFTDWVEDCAKDEALASSDGSLEVWGNGVGFDNAILAEAYRKCTRDTPWKFWEDRCYRTLKALHEDTPFVESGVNHNALDDARSQALHLIQILNKRYPASSPRVTPALPPDTTPTPEP